MRNFSNIGLKLTPQRLAIFDYLDGNKDHPSAEDIYKAVSERFPTMSFATVYNNLQTLKDKGLLQELTFDPMRKRFDPNTGPHNHIICIICKKIVDVEESFDVPLPTSLKEDFEIIGSRIEFYGLCKGCKTG